MLYALLGLFAALIIAADQAVKYLVVLHIPLGHTVPAIPGILHVTYVKNTGAAFSVLQGSRWFFVAMVVVFVVVLAVLLKRRVITAPVQLWCLAAIFGGGVGNMLDRIFRGFVVDMFETAFMTFPVFNVADIFITLGCIILVIHILFFDRKKPEAAP